MNENLNCQQSSVTSEYQDYINNWFSSKGDIDDFIFYQQDSQGE